MNALLLTIALIFHYVSSSPITLILEPFETVPEPLKEEMDRYTMLGLHHTLECKENV